jgi:hypothetical protein
MNYGILFGGNPSCSNIIFKLQKRIIGIVMGARTRGSCKKYFKKTNSLPFQPQYTRTLACIFVINNKNQFAANSGL